MISEDNYLRMTKLIADYKVEQLIDECYVEQPYLEEVHVTVERKYNPNYGDYRKCKCGDYYHRHFDSYENNAAVGCKYCDCLTFEEKIEAPKRRLNNFIYGPKMDFGDYVLFQEYRSNARDHTLRVSRPILAIYLGCFVIDQTLGFNYVKWNNDKHIVYVTNENVTRYPTCKEVSGIDQHIEWMDYIDILGHWKHKPGWKEIIKSYRLQNLNQSVNSDQIQW